MSLTRVPFTVLASLDGTLWLANGAVRLTKPTYWAPTTLIDYTAVLLFSAASFVLGVCILRLVVGRRGVASVTPKIAGASAIATSLANLLEDGLGLAPFGIVFVIGALMTMIALLLLGIVLAGTPGVRALGVPPLVTVWSVLLGPPGFFVLGLCWVAVGALGLARVSPFHDR